MSNKAYCDRHRVKYHVDDGCYMCNENDRYEQMQKSLGKLRTDLDHRDAEIAALRADLAAAQNELDTLRKVVWHLDDDIWDGYKYWYIIDEIAKANGLDIPAMKKAIGQEDKT